MYLENPGKRLGVPDHQAKKWFHKKLLEVLPSFKITSS
jgi:hypothetical protein